jgi:hypothetical protein
MELVQEAQDTLLLVTPYYRPWTRLENCIKNAHLARDVDTAVLLRGGKDREKQREAASDILECGIFVRFLERLHAKVYLNEKQAIITSMNLLETSALDSWEVSVNIQKRDNPKAYNQAIKECSAMFQQANEEATRAEQRSRSNSNETLSDIVTEANGRNTDPGQSGQGTKSSSSASSSGAIDKSSGVCIRCADEIDLEPERPLCKSCWKLWAKYKNEDYEEDYCHSCGKEETTSFRKPLCYPCFQKLD